VQYAFFAGFPFRFEAYLVPTLPLVAALGGLAAASLDGPRARWLPPLAALALLAVSVARAPPRNPTELEAIQRHDSLAALGQFAEPDAVLLTTSDPALVEPLFRAPGRSVLYIGPYISPLVEQGALRELGATLFQPHLVARYAGEMLQRGRPVFFDGNPPPRGALPEHKTIRKLLMKAYRMDATTAPFVFRVAPLVVTPVTPGPPPPGPSGR